MYQSKSCAGQSSSMEVLPVVLKLFDSKVEVHVKLFAPLKVEALYIRTLEKNGGLSPGDPSIRGGI
jgi:hypothetical protein